MQNVEASKQQIFGVFSLKKSVKKPNMWNQKYENQKQI